MLVDTCNSGELDKDEVVVAAENVSARVVGSRGLKRSVVPVGSAAIGALLAELFADLRRSSGAIVISAAGGAEYALESEAWKNGVFTYTLLEGLKSKRADANRDGRTMTSELREYVGKEVRRLTQGAQTPTVRRDNLDNDFALQ